MVSPMITLTAKIYTGDEEFSELLRREAFKGSIDRIKACILGLQCSPEKPVLSPLLDLIRKETGREPSRDSVSAVEGLWHHLYARSDFPDSEHIRLPKGASTPEAYIAFVQRQLEAGEEFLKQLGLGGFDAHLGNETIRKPYLLFMSNIELLRALEISMREKWTEVEFFDMDGFIKKLESFTMVMWNTMMALKNMMKNEKLKLFKSRSIISEIEEKMGQAVQRNDPCPCGSGKKYKKCCGS